MKFWTITNPVVRDTAGPGMRKRKRCPSGEISKSGPKAHPYQIVTRR
jgi:hypothetical protein